MPAIPLYNHEPKSLPSPNVRADPAIFDKSFQAAARLGDSVAGIGSKLSDYVRSLQTANDFTKSTEVDLALRDEFFNYTQTITPASDPEKMLPEWERKIDGVIAKSLVKMPPSIRPQVEAAARRFKQEASHEISKAAQQMVVSRARKTGLAAVETAWRDFDEATASTLLTKMGELGVIDPSEIPALKAKGAQTMEYQLAFDHVNRDPAGAIDSLEDRTEGGRPKNFKSLGESQRYALLQSARNSLNTLRASTQEELFTRRQLGEVIPENELDGLVARKAVSPTWAKRFRAEQMKSLGGAGGNAVQFAEVLGAIGRYDPIADGGRTDYASLFADAMLLPDKMASEAITRLKEKLDPASPLNSPVAKSALESIEQRFQKGIYGQFTRRKMIVDGPEAGQWTTETDSSAYEKALTVRSRVEDATRSFLKANPNASAEQVQKFVSDFQQGETVKAGRAALLNGVGIGVPPPEVQDDAKAKKAKLEAILSRK